MYLLIMVMCGVEGKRRILCSKRHGFAPTSRHKTNSHIRCVLLVNSPNKLNLLLWLLIYLCNNK